MRRVRGVISEVARQQVAFGEKTRKNEGLESLEEDFYTRFMTEN